MTHFRHSLNLEADPATAYAALTTPEGLRGWWTQDCEVPTAAGGTLRIHFGGTHKQFRVERLDAAREVRWRCTQAHIDAPQLTRRDEWVGTEMVFRLTPQGTGTRLDFEHLGLVPEFECYGLCTKDWTYFLDSLRQFAESGRGTPYDPQGHGRGTMNPGTRSATTMDSVQASDRIERSIVINAPRDRVWRALSNAEEFGTWFGARLAGQTFAPGTRARGQITVCGHEDAWFDVVVERIEPQDLFAFRWHPYAVDPAVDYAQEEPTLVTFTLKDAPGHGTLLTVVESGFDKVPPHRRMEAFRMNNRGWEAQLNNIDRHVVT